MQHSLQNVGGPSLVTPSEPFVQGTATTIPSPLEISSLPIAAQQVASLHLKDRESKMTPKASSQHSRQNRRTEETRIAAHCLAAGGKLYVDGSGITRGGRSNMSPTAVVSILRFCLKGRCELPLTTNPLSITGTSIHWFDGERTFKPRISRDRA